MHHRGVASRLPAKAGAGLRIRHGATRCHLPRRPRLQVQGAAKSLLPSSIKVDKLSGEGSFGQVYLGTWATPSGDQRVILKRVKAKVEGAQLMAEMELQLNEYAARVVKNHVADFIGYCEVAEDEATSRLTPGLWLMWRYEGQHTLAYYLRRRDTIRALARDMEIAEEAVVATVMKQILEALAGFHAAGLVHRDIKPLNIIFAEDKLRFKLIDLGACADLRSGTNWTPDESILDPNYCPPEQYVLPTDSPCLKKNFLRIAISPMLWAQHKPDRFDMWSAGITLLQLAVPSMRQDRVLKRFNGDIGYKFDYDLDAWRAGSYISDREFAILDADDGAGWELLKALLRPRSIKVLEDNTVIFENDKTQQRISAKEALQHRFVARQAREPGSIMDEPAVSSTSGRGSSGLQGGLLAFMSGGGGSSGVNRSRSGSRSDSEAGSGSGGRSASPAGKTAGKQKSGTGSPGGSTKEQRQTAGTFGAAVGMWRNLTSKLFDLEANIMVTASATQQQSTVVKKLQVKAAKGQVSRDVVAAEERKLNNMQSQLSTMQDDFNSTANAVGNVLGFLGFGPTKPKATPEPPAAMNIKPTADMNLSSASPVKASKPASFFGMSFNNKAAAAEPAPPPVPPPPPPQVAQQTGGLWAAIQRRMGMLENQYNNQADATVRQEFTVRRLRAGVQRGEVDMRTLQKAEAILARMEQRVSALDNEVRKTRQEATGLLGLLASSMRNMSGTGSVKEELQIDEEQLRALLKQQQAANKQQQGGGGVGGFFNRMWNGMNGSSSSSPDAAKPIASPSQPATPAAAAAASSRSPSPVPEASSQDGASSSSTSAKSEPGSPGGTGSVSVASISEGANNLIKSSLNFTGMAAQVAIGMATAMRADAQKILRDLEVEAEAKRKKKVAEQAFLRMLGSKDPPMEPGTSFEEVEEAFGKDPRYLAVEASQRPLLVATFVDALVQAQIRSQQQAQAKLRDLLSLRVGLNATWEEVDARFSTDATFLAVPPDVRRQLYDEVMSALRAAEDNRLAAGLAEGAFMGLLQELQPPITPDSSWPRVKPLMWRDYRYLAVPENRRRELFEEYHAVVCAAASSESKTAQTQGEQEAESIAAILSAGGNDARARQKSGKSQSRAAAQQPAATPATSTDEDEELRHQNISPSLLEQLRNEQARLRSEYDQMERKLREMEAALAAKERASQLLGQTSIPGVPTQPPQQKRNGSGTGNNPAPRMSGTHPQRITAPKPQPLAINPVEDAVLASSLTAAGVEYRRLDDGTLVFSFDEEEAGDRAVNMETVSTNSKA